MSTTGGRNRAASGFLASLQLDCPCARSQSQRLSMKADPAVLPFDDQQRSNFAALVTAQASPISVGHEGSDVL